METDKMSTASSVGAERRPLMQALVIERRILFGCTVFVGLCTFVWIAAVCTSKWVIISGGPNGCLVYLPASTNIGAKPGFERRPAEPEGYLMWSESGVWEICRYVFKPYGLSPLKSNVTKTNGTATTTAWPPDIRNVNGTLVTNCTNYLTQHVLNSKGEFPDKAYNFEVASFVRTMISFGIISLFVMVMGCGFSVYTFQNPRYMFKRLAAGIHFISTSCTIVVVQVMMSTVDFLKKNVPLVYPECGYHYYHISFFLGWFVVLTNLFAAASFLWYSRKRKGDKAATDELAMADEPTIIGR